jgi:Tol biopolymer transport system component
VTFQACEQQSYIRALSTSGRDLGTLVPCIRGSEDELLVDVSAPDWSPDGRRLAFGQGLNYGPVEIATVAADGSDRRTAWPAASGGRGDVEGPSFSPDGLRVAFSHDGSIYTSALDGGELRKLRPFIWCGVDRPGCVYFTAPRWSPDGRYIAVQRTGTRAGLWLVDARDGSLVRRVARGAFEADWSPDSRRLAFRSDYEQDEIKGGASGGNIYVVRADGKGKPRRIVHRKRVAETQPTFSPDGKSIAWVSLGFGAGDVSFDVKPSLWRMRLTGGKPRKIRNLQRPYVEEGDYLPPQLAWQPLPR